MSKVWTPFEFVTIQFVLIFLPLRLSRASAEACRDGSSCIHVKSTRSAPIVDNFGSRMKCGWGRKFQKETRRSGAGENYSHTRFTLNRPAQFTQEGKRVG